MMRRAQSRAARGAGETPVTLSEQPVAQGGDSAAPSMRRRVFALAAPVIGQNFLETLLGIVDTALVARLGATATAGVGSALQVMFFIFAALSALAIGSSVLVAQAVGAGDTARASRLARQSLLWAVVVGVPLAAAGFALANPILGIFGLAPEVRAVGADYLHVTMGTMVVLVALFIGGGVLRGAGDARTPMVVTAIANVVNAILAYLLIYGAPGVPAMGAVGSAWAAFAARALALTLMLAALWRGRAGVSIRGPGGWWPQVATARQIMQIGVPAAIEQVLTSAAFFGLVVVVARLGTVMLAAHQITFTALSSSFLPGFGFAIAATTLVGQSVGARRIDEGAQAARIATGWAAIWMGAIGVLLFIFAEPMLALFTADQEVIAAGSGALRIVALAQPFWAVLFVMSGALRGAGNTTLPLIIGAGGMWLTVGVAYLLAALVGGGLTTVWTAFLICSPVMAALAWRAFRREAARVAEREAAAV